jgi:MFS family permease
MRLMRERGVWTTNLVAFMLGFGMQVSILMLPQLVQVPKSGDVGFGASATQAGLYLVPHALAIVISSPIAGWLGQRVGSRIPLLISIGIALAGLMQIIFFHDRPAEIVLHAFTSGFAVGMAFAAMMNLILGAVPQAQTGMATGMNLIVRSVGGAFQAQISGTILAGTAVAGVLTERGFVIAFVVAAAILVAAFVVALLVPGPARDLDTRHGLFPAVEPPT